MTNSSNRLSLFSLGLLLPPLALSLATLALVARSVHDYLDSTHGIKDAGLNDYINLDSQGLIGIEVFLLILSVVTAIVLIASLALSTLRVSKKGSQGSDAAKLHLIQGGASLFLALAWLVGMIAFTVIIKNKTFSFNKGSKFDKIDAQTFGAILQGYLGSALGGGGGGLSARDVKPAANAVSLLGFKRSVTSTSASISSSSGLDLQSILGKLLSNPNPEAVLTTLNKLLTMIRYVDLKEYKDTMAVGWATFSILLVCASALSLLSLRRGGAATNASSDDEITSVERQASEDMKEVK